MVSHFDIHASHLAVVTRDVIFFISTQRIDKERVLYVFDIVVKPIEEIVHV